MLEHINFAREMQVPYPIKVENGDIVRLSSSTPEVYDKAPYGKIYLDGNIEVEEDSKSIKERKNLASNGYLDITIIINSNSVSLERLLINFKGLPIEDTESFVYSLDEDIRRSLKIFSFKNKKQEENIKENIKILSRKFVKEKTGKKPITNINLIRI